MDGRVFQSEHQAVSHGNIGSRIKAQRNKPLPLSFKLSASSFQLPNVSIFKTRATPDHGLRRRF
jgi:hypothetical protein